MTNEEQLEQIELNMAEAKRFIELRTSLQRLEKNRDFKKLISEYYFKEEAARLVMAKSAGLDETQQAVIDKMIYGIGSLAKFLDSTMSRGAEAELALKENEEVKVEIIQEGLL